MLCAIYRHGVDPVQYGVPIPTENYHEFRETQWTDFVILAFPSGSDDGSPPWTAARAYPQMGQIAALPGPEFHNADDKATAKHRYAPEQHINYKTSIFKHISRQTDLNCGLL